MLFKNEATAVEDSTVGKLAEFFPEATPVSVPVRLRATDAAGNPFSQETQIEFYTSREGAVCGRSSAGVSGADPAGERLRFFCCRCIRRRHAVR